MRFICLIPDRELENYITKLLVNLLVFPRFN
jgi:hypothetical protein